VDSRAGQPRAFVVVCSLLALVVGGLIGYFTPRGAAEAAIAVATPDYTATPEPTPTPLLLRVHVSGAVNDPDVYQLVQGSIVRDAIEAAGGGAEEADLERINLAMELADQMQVYVPREGEASVPLQSSSVASPGGGGQAGLININVASLQELDTLPGVGPVTAQRIVDYREAHGAFQRVEDIQNVSGIGPSRFEAIREQITVAP
jgi:competence protein ComEA